MCGKAGRLECDHVTPLKRDPNQDAYDPRGLQTLCRRCHIEKTPRENRRELSPAETAWRALVADLSGQLQVKPSISFLLIRDTPRVGMYVLNMFRMRGSRLWGSRLHRACVV